MQLRIAWNPYGTRIQHCVQFERGYRSGSTGFVGTVS
jgi:hypothetical protein